MDYINRDDLKKEILSWAVLINHPELLSRDDTLHRIDSIPAANVTEVKHGKWIYDENGTDWNLGAWLCSECRCKNNNLGMSIKINPLMFAGSKFCPNCGARMGYETEKA